MKRVVKKVNPNGLFALRHHEVQDCIDKNEVMHCVHGDETMTMDPESLKSKQVGRSPWITDASGDYYVIDFRWSPNIVNND